MKLRLIETFIHIVPKTNRFKFDTIYTINLSSYSGNFILLISNTYHHYDPQQFSKFQKNIMTNFQENLNIFIFRPKMTIFEISTPEQDFSVTEHYYQMITTDPQHLPIFQKNIMNDFEENLKNLPKFFSTNPYIFETPKLNNSTTKKDFLLL